MSIYNVTSPAGKTYHFDWFDSPIKSVNEEDFYMARVFEGELPPYMERPYKKPHSFFLVHSNFNGRYETEKYPNIVGNVLDTLPQTQAGVVRARGCEFFGGSNYPHTMCKFDFRKINEAGNIIEPNDDYTNTIGFDFYKNDAITLWGKDAKGKDIYWLVHPDCLDVGIEELYKLASYLTDNLNNEDSIEPVKSLKAELEKLTHPRTIAPDDVKRLLQNVPKVAA